MEKSQDHQELFEAMVYNYWAEANKMFGENLKNWQYNGINYGDEGPMIRYFPQNREVKIMLLPLVKFDLFRGLFQLSHEVVHLVSLPKEQIKYTSNLEEGCAVWFSFFQINKLPGGSDYLKRCEIEKTNYGKPYELVSKLLGQQKEAIKFYRKHQPIIGKIGLPEFEKVGTFGLSKEEVMFLSQTFIGR